jgi:hypothetical protein
MEPATAKLYIDRINETASGMAIMLHSEYQVAVVRVRWDAAVTGDYHTAKSLRAAMRMRGVKVPK